ncbi:hypothetical protein DFH28DRAFT_959856 [Melampsora americana]|nr:hypothetical protein DFH28DRAFT_959856 [Melampsora americana]
MTSNYAAHPLAAADLDGVTHTNPHSQARINTNTSPSDPAQGFTGLPSALPYVHPDFNPEADSYHQPEIPLAHTSSYSDSSFSRKASTSQPLLPSEPQPHHFSSVTLVDPAEQRLLRASPSEQRFPQKSFHLPTKMTSQHHLYFPSSSSTFIAQHDNHPHRKYQDYPESGSLSAPVQIRNPSGPNDSTCDSLGSDMPQAKELFAFPASPPKPKPKRLSASHLIILGLFGCILIGAAIGVVVYIHIRHVRSADKIAGYDGDVIARSGLGSARNGTGSDDPGPFDGGTPGPDNGLRGGINGYDSLVVFGASYCDNAHARPALYEASLKRPPYFKGRWTDGYVWNEYLSQMIGPLGGRTTLVNYAYGSATVDNSISSADVPDFDQQVDAFTSDLKSHSPGAGPYKGKSMVAAWVGLNSLTKIWNKVLKAQMKAQTAAEAHDSVLAAQTSINSSVDEIFNVVGNLARSDAFAGPPPDILLLPIPPGPLLLVNIRAAKGNTRSLQTLDNLSQMFNMRFSNNLADFQTKLPSDQRVFTYDIPALWKDFVANPMNYGISVVDQPCYAHNSVCTHPNEYLFWDTLHPTTYIHQKLAVLLRDVIRT